jgi:hypothetical protein
MATRKVTQKLPKVEAGEVPAAASETPVAQPEAAKSPSKRAPKVVKLAPTPEVKTADIAVKTPTKPRATRAAKQVTEPATAPKPAAAPKPVAAPEQVKAAEPAKPSKPAKIRRAKLVRDSYTMPEAEHELITGLKKRCLSLGVAAKKSEILRAALAVLARLSDAEVTAAIRGLAVIKTGRPAKGAK